MYIFCSFFLLHFSIVQREKSQKKAKRSERILQLTVHCLVIYRLVCDYIQVCECVCVCGDSKVVFEKQFSQAKPPKSRLMLLAHFLFGVKEKVKTCVRHFSISFELLVRK